MSERNFEISLRLVVEGHALCVSIVSEFSEAPGVDMALHTSLPGVFVFDTVTLHAHAATYGSQSEPCARMLTIFKLPKVYFTNYPSGCALAVFSRYQPTSLHAVDNRTATYHVGLCDFLRLNPSARYHLRAQHVHNHLPHVIRMRSIRGILMAYQGSRQPRCCSPR